MDQLRRDVPRAASPDTDVTSVILIGPCPGESGSRNNPAPAVVRTGKVSTIHKRVLRS
jgi:hypothetical protein